MARKSTGKRQRFEIFNRDGFTCQYCGARPPDVILVLDHIMPIAAGGSDDPLNLITACEPCNQGKSDKIIGNIPKPDADLEWLEMQQEIAELRRYQQAKKIRDELTAEIIDTLQETWCDGFNTDTCPAEHVIRGWLSFAEPSQIEDAIKIASQKSYRLSTFTRQLKYTAGVLRNLTGTRSEADET